MHADLIRAYTAEVLVAVAFNRRRPARKAQAAYDRRYREKKRGH